MSESFIIEVRRAAVGLVVREQDGFRFFSANAAFAELESRVFTHPSDAENAAVHHAARAADIRRRGAGASIAAGGRRRVERDAASRTGL